MNSRRMPRPEPGSPSWEPVSSAICLVEHPARLSRHDLMLIDKGPLPNPGGSTGHASNFIFPTDYGREIALLTFESQRQYEALGVNTTCGGIEVARTEERMEELRRRMTWSRVRGIESRLLRQEQGVAIADARWWPWRRSAPGDRVEPKGTPSRASRSFPC